MIMVGTFCATCTANGYPCFPISIAIANLVELVIFVRVIL